MHVPNDHYTIHICELQTQQILHPSAKVFTHAVESSWAVFMQTEARRAAGAKNCRISLGIHFGSVKGVYTTGRPEIRRCGHHEVFPWLRNGYDHVIDSSGHRLGLEKPKP